jgi:hypothetical protein
MTWVLTICTVAWGLCGTFVQLEYPTEDQCYKALDTVYRQQGREKFKYVTCSAKQKEKNT